VSAEIKRLLELQAIDAELAELSFQVDQSNTQRKRIKEKMESERASVDTFRQRLAQLEHESRMKNLDVDELDEQIRQYQQRLDRGIISFKEMEDLRIKIGHERERINAMEDEALALMDRIEETNEGLAEAQAHLRIRESELRAQIEEIERQLVDIRRCQDELAQERTRVSETIAPYLLAQYEALRTKLSGPLATIHHSTCSGCKLKVSGSTLERVRGGMGIVTCEHCSRILYLE